MLSIWYGAEPYRMERRVSKESSGIELPEFNVSNAGALLDSETFELCYQPAIGADRRYIVLVSESLANPYLEKLMKDLPDNDVRIICTGVDKRTSTFKKASKNKLIEEFPQLNPSEFNQFLLANIKKCGISIYKEDFDFLVDHIAYGNREGCDLYTVSIFLRQLRSVSEHVTRDIVIKFIPKCRTENNFELYQKLVKNDRKGYFTLLGQLLGEGESGIAILSLLLYNFRIAYKVALVGNTRAASVLGLSYFQLKNIGDVTLKQAEEAMQLLQTGCNDIKTGADVRYSLMSISAKLFRLL